MQNSYVDESFHFPKNRKLLVFMISRLSNMFSPSCKFSKTFLLETKTALKSPGCPEGWWDIYIYIYV